ncbi:MAG: DUF2809 domain-containing protein [Richelia sp. SL_2_1]|nr:DUF2809 domain-containing protein [Richelia sp. SM1_7_0]NJO31555.1 DUF2809 domain-containing protein [Richelia sp. SL_2_1]
MNSSVFKYRLVLLANIIIIIPLGYIVRFSQGLNPAWLHDALGAVAYEIFWILLFAFLLPRVSLLRIAIAVCLATCALEFLQLWKPPFLQAIRSTLPGRLVLGNTFVWTDFPVYFVGSFLGWLWVRFLKVKGQRLKVKG